MKILQKYIATKKRTLGSYSLRQCEGDFRKVLGRGAPSRNTLSRVLKGAIPSPSVAMRIEEGIQKLNCLQGDCEDALNPYLINAIPFPIIVFDKSMFVITMINGSMEPDSFSTQPKILDEFPYPKDVKKKIKAQINYVFESKETSETELHILGIAGEHTYRAIFTLTRDGFVALSLTDITSFKQMRYRIMQENRRYKEIIDTVLAHDGLIRLSPSGILLDICDNALRVIGKNLEDLQNQHYLDILKPLGTSEIAQYATHIIEQALEGKSVEEDRPIQYKKWWFSLKVYPLLTQTGVPLELVILVKDVTSRMKDRMLYEGMLENSDFPILMHMNRRIIAANNSMLTILKYDSLSTIKGQDVIELVPPQCRNMIEKKIETNEKYFKYEFQNDHQLLCSDGTIITVDIFVHQILIGDEFGMQIAITQKK